MEDYAEDPAPATPSNGDELLTTEEVMRITKHTRFTLNQYRSDRNRKGKEVGPAFEKRGHFAYYRRSEVEAYMATRKGA